MAASDLFFLLFSGFLSSKAEPQNSATLNRTERCVTGLGKQHQISDKKKREKKWLRFFNNQEVVDLCVSFD